jgi:signal transduction histidine kinase
MSRAFGRAFSAPFPRAVLEALLTGLALQALALMWTQRLVPSPWPELLAFTGEHALWLVGALRLRPSHGPVWWRLLRVPLFGGLAGLGFAVLGSQLAQWIPPSRPFFDFQALSAPDPEQFLGTGLNALVLTATLRFVFAYAYRAVWLEGRRSLRWRLTALALGGGVLASGLVAVLPGLVALVRDPSRNLTGAALRDARDLALTFTPTLQLGLDDSAVRQLMLSLKRGVNRPRPRLIEPDPDMDMLPIGGPGRTALILSPYGQVLASSRPSRFDTGPLPETFMALWSEVIIANATGRCRATVLGNEVVAGCPAFGNDPDVPSLSRRWVIALVLQPAHHSGASFSDVIAQLAHDLTLVLDTLSQSFLPIFAVLGFLGYLTARRLTGPLETLLVGSQSLEAGRWSVRVPVEGEDEVARLGAGWNAMADRLETNIEALGREKSNVESLLRANRRLTASASHELRTPLTVMRAHLESAELRGEAVSGEAQRVLQSEVARLERLVEDLFTLSRADLGQLDVRLEPVEPVELMHALARSLQPVAEAGRITLLEAIPDVLPRVRADRQRLTQAVVNLVQNALKYTPEGGLVRLEAETIGDRVRLSVLDTGIGIDQADLDRIFEPFYRTDASRARTTGGAGLGLALARELVEAMGGTLHAESESGRGSRFSLELPIWTPPFGP